MPTEAWLLAPEGALRFGETLVLEAREAAHVTTLRRRAGDPVALTDGRGLIACAVLRKVARARIEVEVTEVRREPMPQGPGVTVALGVLHGQPMDWAIQKMVEVGVRRVIPLVCARSQLSFSAVRGRHDHWLRVAEQALKQCHRAWAMKVDDAVDVVGLVAGWGSRIGVVASRDGDGVEALSPGCELLVVGPEGGLSEEESATLAQTGWKGLRLGSHVLRADTAAVVGASFVIARQCYTPRHDDVD
jgi:16S rRNA (uracil1498-N3)-methyltransferase